MPQATVDGPAPWSNVQVCLFKTPGGGNREKLGSLPSPILNHIEAPLDGWSCWMGQVAGETIAFMYAVFALVVQNIHVVLRLRASYSVGKLAVSERVKYRAWE